MFLNPPAEEKSIVFCSPMPKKIENAVSSVQFAQLNCLALIQISGLMADKKHGVGGAMSSSTKFGFVSGNYTESSAGSALFIKKEDF